MRYLKRAAELVGAGEQGEHTVEHVISVMGNVDDGGDVVMNGAFTKTLRENGPLGADRIRATWMHDLWEPIGRPLEMNEVGRGDLPEAVLARAPGATGGLHVVTKISMTQRGRDAHTLLVDGVLNEWSIGYFPVKWEWEEGGASVRHLQELKLVEYGLVTLAMNPGALTETVKAVVEYQDLPLGDEDAQWDAAAAEKRVRAWAGGDPDLEGMDWEKYRGAFVLWDRGNAEQVGGYKLGIGDIVDGKLVALPRGVFAAGAAIQGARTPIREFDEGDLDGAKSHLARYYERMERTAPWDREAEAEAVSGLLELVLSKGRPTRPVGLADVVGELVRLDVPGARDGWSEEMGVLAARWVENARLLKEGRVLSGTNRKLIRNAVTQMQEAVNALVDLLAAAEPGPKDSLTAARDVLARRILLGLAELN